MAQPFLASMRIRPGSRDLACIVAICSAILFAPLMWPLLTGRVFTFNDFGWFHLPLRYLYHQALSNGDSLLWTPAVLSGFYIHGEGQVGLFHPFHQLLYRVVAFGPALNVEFLASYVASYVGTWWLLRRLEVQHAGALFGAMLFAFSGFSLLHMHHVNMIAVVAHIPWLLGATDVLFESSTRRSLAVSFAAIALIFASEHLLGFPQGVWWSVLAFGAFAIFKAAESHRWSRLYLAFAAGAISALLGAVQLLPTIEASRASIRPLLPPDFALTYSLHPANLLQLWSPYVFAQRVYSPLDYPEVAELGVYSACIGLVALPWLWVRRQELSRHRRFIVASLCFAVSALVLALGRYGGPDRVVSLLPGLGSLRAPARYVVLFQFAVALLAAIAFDDLASGHAPVRLRSQDVAWLSLPLILSAATTLCVNTHLWGFGLSLPVSSLARASAGTAMVFSVTVLLLLASQRIRFAIPLLIVLTALDLGVWGIRPAYQEPIHTLESIRHGMPARSRESSAKAYVDDPRLGGNLMLLQDYWLAWGYVALYPAVIYHHTDRVTQALSGASLRFSPEGWPTHQAAVPRARLLADVLVTNDFRRDEQRVDLFRTALLDAPILPLTGPSGTATILIDRPGHIVIHVHAGGRQLLSVSERFHNGWSVLIDGSPATTVAIHHDFLGCVVPSGDHHIEFRFMPRSFVYGCALSFAGVLCLGLSTIAVMRSVRSLS